MFGLGMPEVTLILVLAVFLFGARKLPELARGVGRALGEFRKAQDDFNQEMRRAVDEAPDTRDSPRVEDRRDHPDKSA